MNYIFHYVDPVLLFKSGPSYKYYFFVLYEHSDHRPRNRHDGDKFANVFRSSMGHYHDVSGKDIGLFVFDYPSDRWVERNIGHFIKAQENSSIHAEWKSALELVKQSLADNDNIENYIIPSINSLRLEKGPSEEYRDRLMKLFKIEKGHLPTVLILIDEKPERCYFETNIGIGHIDSLLSSCSQEVCGLDARRIKTLPKNISIPKIMELLNNVYSSAYERLTGKIYLDCIEKEPNVNLPEMLSEFSQFNDLKSPERFEFRRAFVDGVRKYNNAVDVVVKQLNLLDSNKRYNSLRCEKVKTKDLWRFRVNDSLRCHYTLRNDKYICLTMGEHDLGL